MLRNVFMPGPTARLFARDIFRALPVRLRPYVLWDAPMRQRPAMLEEALKNSGHVSILFDGQKPLGCAWFVPLCPDSATAAAHFAIPPMPLLDVCARQALAMAAARYRCLLALIPRPFHGARNFARSLGFVPIGRLPRACSLHARRRVCDGVLYQLSLFHVEQTEKRP